MKNQQQLGQVYEQMNAIEIRTNPGDGGAKPHTASILFQGTSFVGSSDVSEMAALQLAMMFVLMSSDVNPHKLQLIQNAQVEEPKTPEASEEKPADDTEGAA